MTDKLTTTLRETPIGVVAIMVNYKTAGLTLRSLRSLRVEFERPELDLHVIVVENASGDADALREGIAAEFSDFATLVVAPENGGFGAGNNLGLKAALERGLRPKYVHFINPDTTAHPGAVMELVSFLEAHPKAGLAGGTFTHEDGTPWRIGFRFPSALSELVSGCRWAIVDRLLPEHIVAREMGEEAEQMDWPSGASMMMRLVVLEQVGGFDEAFFLYFEEIDLCLRAQRAGWECWFVPTSCVMHVRGQSTGVTALTHEPRRLPSYWYESRRRYFVKNHGERYAMLADALLLAGSVIGTAKDHLKGQGVTPFFMRDILGHSPLWPRNRKPIEPERAYMLPNLDRGQVA